MNERVQVMRELQKLGTKEEVWLDAADFDRFLAVIPPGFRLSSTRHEGDNFRYGLTVFRKRPAQAVVA